MKFDISMRQGKQAIAIHDNTGKHAGFIADATPTDLAHAQIAQTLVGLFKLMKDSTRHMFMQGFTLGFNDNCWQVIDTFQPNKTAIVISTHDAAKAFSVFVNEVAGRRVSSPPASSIALKKGDKFDEMLSAIEGV